MNHEPEPQMEIHFPDEERRFDLVLWNHQCICGNTPVMERRVNAATHRPEFSVKCLLKNYDDHPVAIEQCRFSEPTPWLPHSEQAIRHWKLVAALSKL